MKLLVIGGASRLGQAVARAYPRATLLIRGKQRSVPGSVIAVADYRDVTPRDFDGFDAVINCTGLVRGSADQLHAANAALPDHLAACAEQARVRHFVHISSFSVYGRADEIDRDTPIDPINPYGRSKADGERMIEAGRAHADVTIVRLPSLYGDGESKLSQLIRTWLRIGWWPCPNSDIARAMMHYDSAAATLVHLATGMPRGAVAAGDVDHFSYRLARRAIGNAGRQVGLIRVPDGLAALASMVGGDRARAVFADSRLTADANAAAAMDVPPRLYSDIAAMAVS